MKRLRRSVGAGPRRPLSLVMEALEDRSVPAAIGFAGFTFQPSSTPDVRALLAPGAYNGAVVTAAPTAASATITGFPGSSTGFNPALALGSLVDPTAGPKALELPGGTAASARSGVELSWSGGKGIVNSAGNDLVIYEDGSQFSPDEAMISVHDATTNTWSEWYYKPVDSFAAYGSTGTAGAFATAYDLSNLGIAAGDAVDKVLVANMTSQDRMASSSGVGQVLPQDNGLLSSYTPLRGSLFPAPPGTGTPPSPFNVSLLYAGTPKALTNPLVDVSVTQTGGSTSVNPGAALSFAITVSNSGPNAAAGTAFTDNIPANLVNATWTSTTSTGVTGSAGSGSGSINETLNLPAGSSITYVLTGTVAATATTPVSNTAAATVPSSLTDANPANNSSTITGTLNGGGGGGGSSSAREFSVGSGVGVNGQVTVYNTDGSARSSFNPFPGYIGGVRVATGDVNGDGVPDIVVGAGLNSDGGHVEVFDGATGQLVASFRAFPGYQGGVNVAVGNLFGSGGEIIVGADTSSPHVEVFSLASGSPVLVSSFLAYANFNGGVSVAAGDLGGSGHDDLITGVATAGPANVKVFDLSSGSPATLASFVYLAGYTGGVSVAAGNLGGAADEFVVAPSSAGANDLVEVYSLASAQSSSYLYTFAPQIAGADTGVRAAIGSVGPVVQPQYALPGGSLVTNSGRNAILVAEGPGHGSTVLAFDPASRAQVDSFTAFAGYNGGIFIG